MLEKVKSSQVSLSEEELERLYDQLLNEYHDNLEAFHVKMPTKGTSKAIWLVVLFKYIGKLVHKNSISTIVSRYIPNAGKDQQVRHISADGWFVLNKGDGWEIDNRIVESIPSGYHILKTTKSPKANFLHKKLKRAGRLSAQNFQQLKIVYGNRCATCGSEEGKPNRLDPSKSTELQEAHMDPFLPLTLKNTIPQCQVCNQAYLEDFVFDDKGRCITIASVRPVLKAHKGVLSELKKILDSRDDI
jgi:hypothetical protein